MNQETIDTKQARWIADLSDKARREVMTRLRLKDPERWRVMMRLVDKELKEVNRDE